MKRSNANLNVANVEVELNKLCSYYNIDVKDARLFVALNSSNYYPLITGIDSTGKLVVEDYTQNINKIKGASLYFGTNKQFLYKRYTITSETHKLVLDEAFKTGWESKNYVIFRNGLKLNPNMYFVSCPTLGTSYTTKTVYTTVTLKANDRLDIFYIEGNDVFHPIEFNKDVYIRPMIAKPTTTDLSTIVIPYPYGSYPHDSNLFLVYDVKHKKFLKEDKDEFLFSNEKTSIQLSKDYELESRDDYVIFLFPACITCFEDSIDKVNDVDYMNIYTLTASSGNSSNQTLNFPNFTGWTLTKDNTALFKTGNKVRSDEWEIVNNTTIKLKTYDTPSTFSYTTVYMYDMKLDDPDSRRNQTDHMLAKYTVVEDEG